MQALHNHYAIITQPLRNHYADAIITKSLNFSFTLTQFNYAALRNSLRNSLYAITLRTCFTQLFYAEILVITHERKGKFYAEILIFTQWATC